MRKLAVLAFCAASFFPACSQEVKTRQRPIQACLVDQPKNDIKASFCNPDTGEKTLVGSDRIVFVSSNQNGIQNISVSLENQTREHGKIIAAAVNAGVIYFLTEYGRLFRYSNGEAIPLRMADKQLSLGDNAIVRTSNERDDEFIVVTSAAAAYNARYSKAEEAFFFQVN